MVLTLHEINYGRKADYYIRLNQYKLITKNLRLPPQHPFTINKQPHNKSFSIYTFQNTTELKMESGSIFLDLEEVQNGEHFNTSMSSSGVATVKRKRLTNLEKRDIVHRLSLNFCNGKLQKGSINTLATDFGVSRITIYTI